MSPHVFHFLFYFENPKSPSGVGQTFPGVFPVPVIAWLLSAVHVKFKIKLKSYSKYFIRNIVFLLIIPVSL